MHALLTPQLGPSVQIANQISQIIEARGFYIRKMIGKMVFKQKTCEAQYVYRIKRHNFF